MLGGRDSIMRQTARILALAAGVLLLGSLGYMSLEGWDFFDALYMTVITLTTVGFGEVHPMGRAGRAFTIVLMLAGAGGVLYTLSTLLQYIMGGELTGDLARRRIRRMVNQLSDHVIVCGYGRVGREVARQLKRQAVPFVILDLDEGRVAQATGDGWLALCADAAKDETLEAAGVTRARALITAVESDAANIYITLSARVLAPALHIVARANDPDSEGKLRRVGASRVLSPHSVGGRHMALLAVRSKMVDFVDMVMSGVPGTGGGANALLLETLALAEGSPFVGLTFAGARVRTAEFGTLLAVTHADGQIVADPATAEAAAPLRAGDVLILIGQPELLKKLETIQ